MSIPHSASFPIKLSLKAYKVYLASFYTNLQSKLCSPAPVLLSPYLLIRTLMFEPKSLRFLRFRSGNVIKPSCISSEFPERNRREIKTSQVEAIMAKTQWVRTIKKRQNGAMQAIAGNLSEEDIKALAAFFGSL